MCRMSALAATAVALSLLEDHLNHCVTHAIEAGGPEATAKVREATAAVERLVRSIDHPVRGFERDPVGVGEVDGAHHAVLDDLGDLRARCSEP